MWDGSDNIIWNMENEEPIPVNNLIYNILKNYLDYNTWSCFYLKAYKEWLNGYNSNIYDLNFSLNKQVIELLPSLNKKLIKYNISIYYWFDVDRDLYENFTWEVSPITKKKLTTLKNMHINNSLICEDSFMVFPR